MVITKGMMSSEKQDWETPWSFIDKVQQHFGYHITLDVCAYPHTAKANRFFTEDDDALTKEWDHPVCWMNPPYGRVLKTWLQYAHDQSLKHGNKIICLVPARTDTAWFHDIAVYGKIIFLRGRIKFLQGGKDVGSPAFPSMLVIFGEPAEMRTWSWK